MDSNYFHSSGLFPKLSPSGDSELLKELTFQLIITRAMLKTMELDQILYIILSGITHGDGLNFNRAALFLAWTRRNELRITRSAGPASGEEAHRIWEGVKAEKLDLSSLLDRYSSLERGSEVQFLTRELSDFSLRLSEAKPLDINATIHLELVDVISHCVATRAPYLINGIEAHYYSMVSGNSLTFKNLACIPIFLEERVFGVILVDNYYNHRTIQESEIRGLTLVANLASIALERALLYKKLAEMANLDGLTSVFNRRYYEQSLQSETIRAKRLDANLGIIVFDIDFFKKYNDSYGHECGDQVLIQFAKLLKDNVRVDDIVARYGGEEFVVLITRNPTPAASLALAQKLRARVEQTSFCDFPPGTITVSAGVSCMSARDDVSKIFSQADQALYEAKASGRNCAILFGNKSLT